MDLDTALTVWTTRDPAMRRNPYPAYAVLRRHGPVHQVTPPGADTPVWIVVGYEACRQALTDPRLTRDVTRLPVAGRPVDPITFLGLDRSMIAADPPDHTRLRRLAAHAFSPRRVEQLRPRVQQLTDELLDRIADRQEVDLVDTLAFPLPAAVICELLGIPVDEQATFRGWIRDLFAPNDQLETITAAGRSLAGYLTNILDVKRRHPADDLISALIEARDGEAQLSEAELLSTITLLLIAGHETTVNLIAAAAVALLRHPDQLADLQAHPELITDAVEELLRFDGPAETAGARWALTDLTISGTKIPAGATVMVVLGAANHDPQYVTDADRLDLRRHPAAHLAFSHGVHYCLGAPLGRLEAQIALLSLVRRYPNLRLAVPADQLYVAPNMSIRSLRAVPVMLA